MSEHIPRQRPSRRHHKSSSGFTATTLRLAFTGLLLSTSIIRGAAAATTSGSEDVHPAHAHNYHNLRKHGLGNRRHGRNYWSPGIMGGDVPGVLRGNKDGVVEKDAVEELAFLRDAAIPSGPVLGKRVPVPQKSKEELQKEKEQRELEKEKEQKELEKEQRKLEKEESQQPKEEEGLEEEEEEKNEESEEVDEEEPKEDEEEALEESEELKEEEAERQREAEEEEARKEAEEAKDRTSTTSRKPTSTVDDEEKSTTKSTQSTPTSTSTTEITEVRTSTYVVTSTRDPAVATPTGTGTNGLSVSSEQEPGSENDEANNSNTGSNDNTPMISGIVAGSVVFIVLVALSIRIFIGKRRERSGLERLEDSDPPQPPKPELAPAAVIIPMESAGSNQPAEEMREFSGGKDMSGRYSYAGTVSDQTTLARATPPPTALMPASRGTRQVTPGPPQRYPPRGTLSPPVAYKQDYNYGHQEVYDNHQYSHPHSHQQEQEQYFEDIDPYYQTYDSGQRGHHYNQRAPGYPPPQQEFLNQPYQQQAYTHPSNYSAHYSPSSTPAPTLHTSTSIRTGPGLYTGYQSASSVANTSRPQTPNRNGRSYYNAESTVPSTPATNRAMSPGSTHAGVVRVPTVLRIGESRVSTPTPSLGSASGRSGKAIDEVFYAERA